MTKKTPPKAVKKKTVSPKAKTAHTREARKPRIVKTKPVVVKAPAPVPSPAEDVKFINLPYPTKTFRELRDDNTKALEKLEIDEGQRDGVLCNKTSTLTQQQWDAAVQDLLATTPYEDSSVRGTPTWLKVAGGVLLAAVAGVVWYVVQV